MATYDSDSSDGEDADYTETGVLLGYASKEPTEDDISQLGGYPTWLDFSKPPPATLAKCRVCSDLMTLLLQLNGDLPEPFPGHERRLYLFNCRRRTCTRKEGSVRAFRSIRVNSVEEKSKHKAKGKSTGNGEEQSTRVTQPNIGDTLFGNRATSTTNASPNPFSTSSGAVDNPFSTSTSSNPFSTATAPLPSMASLASKPPQRPVMDDLPKTFAEKARISTPHQPPTQPPTPPEPWPPRSQFPSPYPFYHLDADYETISKPATPPIPHPNIDIDEAPSTSNSKQEPDEKTTFESTLDKPFQHFADRLAQNPLQVLRYQFRGSPLLYSKTDKVGKLLAPHQHQPHQSEARITTTLSRQDSKSGIPQCSNCGAPRVFELQLTPQAIAELEVDELGLEGMEWGIVILGVCSRDCQQQDVGEGEVGYTEEWVGVQWEEVGGGTRG
ncbi:MAG: hypothetical protein M1830_001467 [Pleopsidium flavum]|nr:MAG: hypothetical protein M1830_001467 [Pleopsidium flavum]